MELGSPNGLDGWMDGVSQATIVSFTALGLNIPDFRLFDAA